MWWASLSACQTVIIDGKANARHTKASAIFGRPYKYVEQKGHYFIAVYHGLSTNVMEGS